MKKITSLSLGLSFLIMGYTGVILYISPHGRISKWLDWHFLGLDKTQYEELHTTSMITVLLFAILHIYYNWKPILSYMRNKQKKISFTKKEFLIAFFINMAFVLGTIWGVQPFKGFLDFGESIKDSWGEKSSLQADHNDTNESNSTNTITIAIKPPPEQLGRKTLQELSDMGNINLERAIKVLKEKGIKDIDEESKIRHISNDSNLTTTEIYKLMTE